MSNHSISKLFYTESFLWTKPSEGARYIEPSGKDLKKPSGLSLRNSGLYIGYVGWSKEVSSYFSVWYVPGLGLVPYGTFILRKQTNHMISLETRALVLHFKICGLLLKKPCIMKENRIWLHCLCKWCLDKSMLEEYQRHGPCTHFWMFSLLCVSWSCFSFPWKGYGIWECLSNYTLQPVMSWFWWMMWHWAAHCKAMLLT